MTFFTVHQLVIKLQAFIKSDINQLPGKLNKKFSLERTAIKYWVLDLSGYKVQMIKV